jgi:hypothetical protein
MVKLQRSNDKLRKRLSRAKTPAKQVASLKKRKQDTIDQVSQFLGGLSLQFVIAQIILSGNKSSNGKRYSDDMKTLALSIFNSSPKTYRLLRRIFQLPCISTLKGYMARVEFKPGFQDDILHALKEKMQSLPDSSKDCVIVFDEMAIKQSYSYDAGHDRVVGFEDLGNIGRTNRVANHASVFLVRGLFDNWKQPFGYFFFAQNCQCCMFVNSGVECD